MVTRVRNRMTQNEFETTNDMVNDSTLIEGQVVRTSGGERITDGGGCQYEITVQPSELAIVGTPLFAKPVKATVRWIGIQPEIYDGTSWRTFTVV